MRPNQHRRLSNFADRPDRDRADLHRLLPGLHEVDPVRRPRLPAQGRRRGRPEHPRQEPGADLRRRRRRGQRRPARDRRQRERRGRGDRHDGPQGHRAADPPGRDAAAAPAPLPRGQPVRRPAPGQPRRARAAQRLGGPAEPDLELGPVRPGPHLAAGARPAGPADLPQGVRRRPRPVRRRQGLPGVVPDLAGRLRVHLAGEPGAARHPARRPGRIRLEPGRRRPGS